MGMMPRLAIVTGNLVRGGTTTFLLNLGGELVRRGVPFLVVSLEKENHLANDFIERAIPVITLDESKLLFEDQIKIALRHLAKFEPDVVVGAHHAISCEPLRYLPSSVKRVVMLQTDDDAHIYDFISDYVAAGVVDTIVGVSETICRKIAQRTSTSGVPVVEITHGVPVASWPYPPRDDSRPLRILYHGRLDQPQKRVRLFPIIFQHLVQSGIPFEWTIAGEGPEREYLQMSMRGGRENQLIRFVDAVIYRDVPGLLKGQDITLLASAYEGLPLSLLEAMGHYLVPVVSNLPSGIGQVVDRSNGILVTPENTEGYAEGIIQLHYDRVRLASMSQRAHQCIREKFSIEKMTDRWMDLLDNHRAISVWTEPKRLHPPLRQRGAWRFHPIIRPVRRWIKQRLSKR